MAANTRELTKTEQRDLDRLAESSDFWGRIRAAYAEWGSLTARQYEIFDERRRKDAWHRDAAKIDGKPVRNRYTGKDGRPTCADRSKPWCRDAATVVVGSFGYCGGHAEAARAEFDTWRSSQAQDVGEKESSPGSSAITAPANTSPAKSKIAEYMDRFLADDDDLP